MKRTLEKADASKLKSVDTIVLMEQLSSNEHFCIGGKEPERVFKELNLLIGSGEAWAIYGRSHFEVKLLLEIMANIKPYNDGKCVLVERGMRRNKRVILEHVFYIGNSTMLYDNMNVLEFLMLATAKQKLNQVYRQEKIFETLIEIGLGHLSLTPIEMLTKEEKAVITLLTAAYSDSIMVVFNLPGYSFDRVLINAIARISKMITEGRRTFITGTRDCLLIERACSHTAYVADGRFIYQGTVENLRMRYDKIVLTIKDENVSQVKAWLFSSLPGYRLHVIGDRLLVSGSDETSINPLYVYKRIIEKGFVPQQVEVNPKTVKNAYEEIDRRYDLQKQLFQ